MELYEHPCRAKVGDYVYEVYNPQTPGKVINISKKTFHKEYGSYTDNMVTVKFINGKEKTISDLILRDFNALIADHQKKLQTHMNKLPKLEEL